MARREAKPKQRAEAEGRSARRARRTPDEARALILDAAARLIAERGPDAVGLKDVAREAGVSHALVSHYFGTYEALVDKTLEAEARKVRAELLSKMGSSSADGPEAWIDLVFAALAHPLHGRLAAWAILSGRIDHEDFFPKRDQGMREVAGALEARFRAENGALPFSRDDLEFALLLVMSAGLSYALGREVLWASLAREATPERDAWFRKRLAAAVETLLLSRHPDQPDQPGQPGQPGQRGKRVRSPLPRGSSRPPRRSPRHGRLATRGETGSGLAASNGVGTSRSPPGQRSVPASRWYESAVSAVESSLAPEPPQITCQVWW